MISKFKIRDSNSSTIDLRSSRRIVFNSGLFSQYVRGLYFVLIDAAALIFAQYMAISLSASWNPESLKGNPNIILILGIHFGIFLAQGLYKSGKNRRNYPAILKSVSISTLIILLVDFLYSPKGIIARSTLLLFWTFSFSLISLGRYFSNLVIIKLNKSYFFLHPVFVISAAQDSKAVVELIKSCSYLKFCGWDDIETLSAENIDHTIRRLHALEVSEVYIHSDALQDPMYMYWKLQHAGITIHLLPKDLSPVFREVEISYLHGVPCFKFNVASITGLGFGIKRLLDFVVAIAFLVLVSPVYLLLSIIIYLDDPGPIFYRQLRVGLHGRPFKVWKFRTMVTNADQLQKALEAQNESKDGVLFKIKDDPRITRVGKFIRAYSLDELPQVVNVFLGEMSFIGPRPLPLRDVEKFTEHDHIRHEVLPGITGLWQISGRSDIQNFEDVVKLDIRYIEQWSIWLDLKILLKTVFVVLAKSGAY
jgi:exopolysaccharide biosynthesis polyprenyl glycosylphosphotransferase